VRPRFVACLLMLAGAAALLLTVATRTAGEGPLPLTWFALLVGCVAGGVVFALLDPYGFAWLVVSLSAGMGGVVWILSLVEPHALTKHGVLVIASVVGLVGGAGYVVWARRRRDPIPDFLRGTVPLANIVEQKGVQFAYSASGLLHHETATPVEVVLQNCVSEQRIVDIALVEAPLLPGKPRLTCRLPGAISLSPCEVKRVRFPISAAPGATDAVRFVLRLRVTGARGERVRKWRGNAPFTPPGLFQILLVTVLFLPLGLMLVVLDRGGIRLNIAPPQGPGAGRGLPEPSVETVWIA
jgi:hypothetical protein